MALSKLVNEAVKYLGTVRNFSPGTLDSYQSSWDRFHVFLRGKGFPDDIKHFNGDTVLSFVVDLREKGYKPGTVMVRLTGLSSIARVLMKLKDARGKPYLAQDPTRTFEWPTVDAPETKFLLPMELQKFLAEPRPLRESVTRDLFVDTGARCSELVRANVGDLVTFDGKTSLAVTVKGRGRRLRKRHMPISTPVASSLFEYLMARGISDPSAPQHYGQPLLLTGDNRRWTRSGLSALMVRIGQSAGITRFRVSAHKLRHTANVVSRFARLKDGSPLDRWTRSQLLSHENSRSIDRYDHLLPEELFEAREAQRGALERYIAPPKPPLQ